MAGQVDRWGQGSTVVGIHVLANILAQDPSAAGTAGSIFESGWIRSWSVPPRISSIVMVGRPSISSYPTNFSAPECEVDQSIPDDLTS